MSKGRRLLIVLVVTVAVLTVGGLVLKALFPAEKLAALAADRLLAETGAEVTYGPVGLDLWPRAALTIDGLTVALTGEDMAAAQDTDVGPLVSVHVGVLRATAGLAWGPLFKKRIELDRLVLDHPEVTLVTRAPEPESSTAAAVVGTAEASPMAVILAGVSVRDGALTWREEGTGRSVNIAGWRQDAVLDDVAVLGRRLTAFGQGSPLLESGDPSLVGLEGRIDVLELIGFQPEFTTSLSDVGFAATATIGAAADLVELTDVAVTWGGTRFEGQGSVRGEAGDFRLNLQWRLADLDADAVQKAVPQLNPALVEPWTTWLKTAPINIEGLVASGTYTALLPPASDATPADHLQGLDAVITLDQAEFTPPDMTTPWRVQAVAAIEGGALTVSQSRVDIGAGHLDGTMTMAPLGAPDALVSLDAEMHDLPTKIVLETVVPSAAPYLEGGLDGKIVGGFRLGEPEALRSSLTLDGEGILQEGVVHASAWLDGISRYLGDRQDLKEVRFHTLSHLMKVREGRYIIEDLNLVGHDTDWTGDGWIGLDGAIDLGLNIKFPREFRPELGAMTMLAESLRGEDGRLALDLGLTGRAARPTVALDLSAAQNRLQNAVSGGVQGWLDKLKRKD